MEILPMQASHLAAVGPLLVQLGYEVRSTECVVSGFDGGTTLKDMGTPFLI